MRGLRRDRRGAVAIIFAGSFIALMTLVGVVVDLGNIYTAKRALQGATDFAAIAAASDLANAVAAAQANAVVSSYQPSEITSVTLGTYTRNLAIPPDNRFQPAPLALANAATVTMTHQQKLVLMSLFGGSSSTPIVTQATAAQTRVVSFDIGSGVASLNGGIANAILGAAIGGSLSLSAVDYASLASAQVNLFSLASAISLQLGQSGATYGQAAAGTISMTNYIAALETVAPSVMPQLQSLAAAASAGSSTVDLTGLLDFGPYATQLVSDPQPAVTATASVLSLLQASAQVGGTSHQIALSLTPSIPGIASVTGYLTVGEAPVGTSVMAIDQIGATIHTAQVRLYLNVTLAGAVDGGILTLPLYIEVGYGTAQLAALTCNALDSSSTSVTLDVTPGLVNAWIGNVTPASMTNFATDPTVSSATLLNLLGIASVSGAANAQIGNTMPTPVTFSEDDIANLVVKPTSTTDFVGSLISSLVGKLSLQVNVLGLPLLVPPGLTGAVSSALTLAVSPVDQVVSSVLQAAGLNLGVADTWVTGAKCAAASLTN